MRLIYKKPVNAQLLKGDNIVFARIGAQLFQLRFQRFAGLFHLFDAEIFACIGFQFFDGAALDGNAAMAELRANGVLALPSVDESVKLAEEDLLITMTQMEGYVTEGDNTVTVVLDTNLTPELIEEGFVREIISKIQTMRKEAGFEVMDQITIYHKSDEKVSGIFEQYGDTIKSDVLGVNVVADAAGAFADEPEVYSKEWNINGEHVLLGVKKGGN